MHKLYLADWIETDVTAITGQGKVNQLHSKTEYLRTWSKDRGRTFSDAVLIDLAILAGKSDYARVKSDLGYQ